MKTIKRFLPFTILLLTITMFSFAYQAEGSKRGLARVNKMHGIEVYFLSEPLREYKVVVESGGIIDNFNINTVTTKPTTADKAGQLVKAAVKRATNEGVEIDAVIYSNAKTAVGIQFTEEATEENKGIARVKKVKGVHVYVFSEPMVEYETITGNAKATAAGSLGGIMSSSIEEDIDKLVTKAQKAAGRRISDLDAVSYTSGKSGIGIHYTED